MTRVALGGGGVRELLEEKICNSIRGNSRTLSFNHNLASHLHME